MTGQYSSEAFLKANMFLRALKRVKLPQSVKNELKERALGGDVYGAEKEMERLWKENGRQKAWW